MENERNGLVGHALTINDHPPLTIYAPLCQCSPMSDDPLAILYSALREPIGLLVSTPDFDRARTMLYLARSKSGDDRLKVLALRAAGEGFADEGANLLIVKAKAPRSGKTESEKKD